MARIEPCSKRLHVLRTTQEEDGIFQSQHGAWGMLTMEKSGKGDKDGFRATATPAIDKDGTPKPVGGRGPGGPPRMKSEDGEEFRIALRPVRDLYFRQATRESRAFSTCRAIHS